jgi:hypothetical protein
MKRIIALVLSLMLLVAFTVACKPAKQEAPAPAPEQAAPAPAPEKAAPEQPAPEKPAPEQPAH